MKPKEECEEGNVEICDTRKLGNGLYVKFKSNLSNEWPISKQGVSYGCIMDKY